MGNPWLGVPGALLNLKRGADQGMVNGALEGLAESFKGAGKAISEDLSTGIDVAQAIANQAYSYITGDKGRLAAPTRSSTVSIR
jgi:hypothetical protein